MTDVCATISRRLAHAGMNLVGATSVAAYDASVAPSRRLADLVVRGCGVVVVGNGGPALWRAFRAARPTMRPDDPDPLDRFTRDVVRDAMHGMAGATCHFPFDPPAMALDFQTLGELAGLGRRSLVGLLVHPEYGPWIALRAAIVVPDPVTAPRPAEGFDPCPTCVERPCIAACPVGAVGLNGWDVARCAGHRLSDVSHCADGCAARIECVYGRPHRHPAEALAFHQAAARRTMLAYASAARKA